ncbi:MAG TPA: flagellar regulator YcgR PilZN domain-containing protein [Methylophilaceae bacterium]|nr:flagellar regulator YcgR PilZN domain-containing protein [Methylophilaceae bacterium]
MAALVHPHAPIKPNEVSGGSEYLVVSREEITRILLSMMQSSTQLAAYADTGENFLLCNILHVDGARDSVLLGYVPDVQLTNQLLKSKEICFVGFLRDAKIQFNGSRPLSGTYHGQRAFQIHMPKQLWRLQQRASQRHSLGSSIIKIILNFVGVGEVEADVVDISMDGIGIIHYHPHLKLEPGLVINDCEIHIPDETPIKVNVRIQYSSTIQLTDGEIVKCSGCQFIGLTSVAKEVLESYLSALDSSV